MSPPEVDRSGFGPLRRRDDEPVFDEAWQAQVMAVAFCLMEQGVFSNAAWSETLGAELRASAASAESDDVDGYYRAALRALERLVQTRGAIAAESIELRTEQWRRAYLATPHGQPVELSAGEV